LFLNLKIVNFRYTIQLIIFIDTNGKKKVFLKKGLIMDITQDLKKHAYKVAQSFLSDKKPLNSSIASIANSNSLNSEMIDRVCEFANQNVYLSIFNKTQDKSNIQFPKADPNMVKEIISNLDTSDYNVPPLDFKKEPGVSRVRIVAIKAAPDTRRFAFGMSPDVQSKQAKLDKLKTFISFLQDIVEKESQNAELASEDILKEAKGIIADGDSYADLAKLGCRYAKKRHGVEKVASLLTDICKNLMWQGFDVNKEITKVSSAPLNEDFSFFKHIDSYCDAIDKVAGAQEMINNLEKTAGSWKKEILIQANSPELSRRGK